MDQEPAGVFALRREPDRYVLTGSVDDLHVPRTLQDSLTARLDRLGSARAVAQVASVLGREFDVATLSIVAELEPERLRARARSIVRCGSVDA